MQHVLDGAYCSQSYHQTLTQLGVAISVYMCILVCICVYISVYIGVYMYYMGSSMYYVLCPPRTCIGWRCCLLWH
jgi:hypothetical protein